MLAFFSWYIVLVFMGVMVFPITVLLFRCLPEKGYAFTKGIGLLLVSYLFWIGGTLHVISNTQSGITIIVFLVFCISGGLFFKNKNFYLSFIKKNLSYILCIEFIFFLCFAGASFLRSFVPDISGTEKPFEFMLLNSIHNSHFFPPYDAWYAHAPMSYYYFGYITIQGIMLLSRVTPSYAFNLGIASTWALTALGTFGLAYNLLLLTGKKNKKTALFSFFPGFLLLLLGNFEGVIEFFAAHGIGTEGFYRTLGIEGLSHAYHSSQWFPDQYWFFWRATRITTNWNVMEFPFFSFLLGDLHPHVLVLPYVILFLGWILVLLHEHVFARHSLFKRMVLFFTTSFFLGAIAAINTWFFPAMGALLLVLLFSESVNKKDWKQLFCKGLLIFGLMAALSIVLFLPLFTTAHTSIGGVKPVELVHKAGFVPDVAIVSFPSQLFLFWGPLFLLSCFVLFQKRFFFRPRWYSVTGILASVVLWAGVIVDMHGFSGLGLELRARGSSLLTLLFLMVFALVSVEKFIDSLTEKENIKSTFSFALIMLGGIVVYACELFYLQDVMQSRYNTVFKLYYTAWIFFSVGNGIGIAQIFLGEQKTTWSLRLKQYGVLSIVFLASVYSVTSLFNRIAFSQSITLDGTAYLTRTLPDDFLAMQWLENQVKPGELLVEASGGDYSMDNLVSSMTGIPTIIGWTGTHELQIHGNAPEITRRLHAVEMIYTLPSIKETVALLYTYHVDYIYSSPRERAKYGNSTQKLPQLGRSVFQKGDVILYRVKP